MRLTPQAVLFAVAATALSAAVALAADQDAPEEIAGPPWEDSAWTGTADRMRRAEELSQWLAGLEEMRSEAKDRYGLDGSEYDRPELSWTRSSYVQAQMMVHDRYFYDPVGRRYTVDRYLADLKARYGGIDSVLIWHGYPNIGIDDRNQYDLFDDLPGGLPAVRRMIADFHRAHVRVLFPVYVWDQGTRRRKGRAYDLIAKELIDAGADGINGDTLAGFPPAFRLAAERRGRPLALEPELWLGSEDMLDDNTLSWGYWRYAFVPYVSRYKWLETRHMVNICERWATDHTDALQEAFFNGVGFESWENVWGIWMGLNPRDAEALRRIATIERRFSPLLAAPGWVPHALCEQYGIFASKWPGRGEVLWTLVNRNHYPVSGGELAVPAAAGARYFDLWHGVELKPAERGGRAELSFDLEADGFGAILQTQRPPPGLASLLRTMSGFAAKPLAAYAREWRVLPQRLVEIAPTAPAASAPAGMVRIPAGTFLFRVGGVEIEGGNGEGVDVQYPWESAARRYHARTLAMRSFWIDRYPVTNAAFKAFLDATGYRPVDAHNFLRDWQGGTYPAGWGRKPVTWVSLEDARAYAAWAGKRLPHEWEWQYAAQGGDGRDYPWGGQWRDDAAPRQDDGYELPPPSDVDAHPAGASPFGVEDLVGNVWQWTDEYVDEHTRFAVLRGGSHYRPQHSGWYFPQAKRLDEHGKLLLMAPSIDRSGTVGFRCVKDAAPDGP